jgi:hypothetical protein
MPRQAALHLRNTLFAWIAAMCGTVAVAAEISGYYVVQDAIEDSPRDEPRLDGPANGVPPAAPDVSAPAAPKTIHEIELGALHPKGTTPEDVQTLAQPHSLAPQALDPTLGGMRPAQVQLFAWSASRLSHHPLRFEDVGLERYGQSCGVLQPAVSGVRFLGSLVTLPYRIGLDPPREDIYALGYFRPGSAAPHVRETLPLSVRGVMLQGLATAGIVLMFP